MCIRDRYGCYAANLCGKRNETVLVLEYDEAPFQRATYINQARVHLSLIHIYKVQKCILDILRTQLGFFVLWKLHDKKSIMTGAQKGVLN